MPIKIYINTTEVPIDLNGVDYFATTPDQIIITPGSHNPDYRLYLSKSSTKIPDKYHLRKHIDDIFYKSTK